MNVLIVTKLTALSRFQLEPDKYHNVDPETRTRAEASNQRHVATVESAYNDVIKVTGKLPPVVSVNELLPADLHDIDLVVVVGGDGTMLTTSHYLPSNIPVLGVNSDPVFSRGHFCRFVSEDLASALEHLEGHKIEQVTRMKVTVDDVVVIDRVLNEVLFCHTCPAAMTRIQMYDVRTSCSGVWIATGAGSTGAIASAGGVKMPSKDWCLQAVVREPWDHPSRVAYREPLIRPSFTLTSRIADASLYVDGPFLSLPVGIDQRVKFEVSEHPLMLVTK